MCLVFCFLFFVYFILSLCSSYWHFLSFLGLLPITSFRKCLAIITWRLLMNPGMIFSISVTMSLISHISCDSLLYLPSLCLCYSSNLACYLRFTLEPLTYQSYLFKKFYFDIWFWFWLMLFYLWLSFSPCLSTHLVVLLLFYREIDAEANWHLVWEFFTWAKSWSVYYICCIYGRQKLEISLVTLFCFSSWLWSFSLCFSWGGCVS